MNTTINPKRDNYFVKCDCGCSWLAFERDEWLDDESAYYSISILDDRYDHYENTLLGRVKRAANALLGKPTYFNSVCINDPKSFGEFVDALQAMRVDDADE